MFSGPGATVSAPFLRERILLDMRDQVYWNTAVRLLPSWFVPLLTVQSLTQWWFTIGWRSRTLEELLTRFVIVNLVGLWWRILVISARSVWLEPIRLAELSLDLTIMLLVYVWDPRVCHSHALSLTLHHLLLISPILLELVAADSIFFPFHCMRVCDRLSNYETVNTLLVTWGLRLITALKHWLLLLYWLQIRLLLVKLGWKEHVLLAAGAGGATLSSQSRGGRC